MKKILLTDQYSLFLERMALKESTMHPVQKKQLKQAFYGACGQMLILLRDEVGTIEDQDQAIKAMEDLLNQVGQYWTDQITNTN